MLVQQAQGPRIRTLMALCDLFSLALAIWLAHLIRFQDIGFSLKWQRLLDSPGFLLWAAVSLWGLSTAAELFEPRAMRRFSETGVRVGVVTLLWPMGLVLATYLWPQWQFGRGLLLLTAALLAPLILASRRLIIPLLRRRNRSPILVIGQAKAVRDFCRKLETYTSSPWKAVDGAALSRRDVKGRVEQLRARIIVVAGSYLEDRDDLESETHRLYISGVPVVGEVDIWAWFEERLPLDSLSPEFALHHHGFGPAHWDSLHRLISVLDLVLAAILLILSLPLLLLASLLILLTDGLPVIYRQERMGQFGRPFQILKLRTMRRDAERHGPTFATESDPRVTPIGRILRRLRIDELPQLINILRSEMALVGPRPERPEFVDELARRIPFYVYRLTVRPGLTGWAQVHTRYARDTSGHRRKLEYDLYYIRHPSLRLYILTLLRTANAALVGASEPHTPSSRPAQKLTVPPNDGCVVECRSLERSDEKYWRAPVTDE